MEEVSDMWQYTLRDSLRMPPCPRCGSLLGVVRLRGSVYVCMDCLPREAWEAQWVADVRPAALRESRAG